MAVARIAECIVKDEHAVLPVSTVLQGEYGLKRVSTDQQNCANQRFEIEQYTDKNGIEIDEYVVFFFPGASPDLSPDVFRMP